MKYFTIKKTSFRYGEEDNVELFRFEKESLRDNYINYLVKEKVACDENSKVDYEENKITVYPDNDKWCYVFEKSIEEIKIIKSVNLDMSFNYS